MKYIRRWRYTRRWRYYNMKISIWNITWNSATRRYRKKIYHATKVIHRETHVLAFRSTQWARVQITEYYLQPSNQRGQLSALAPKTARTYRIDLQRLPRRRDERASQKPYSHIWKWTRMPFGLFNATTTVQCEHPSWQYVKTYVKSSWKKVLRSREKY